MSSILKLNGLPFKITSAEIHDWISELSEVEAEKVHMISNRQGLASGQAYVEFKDKSQSKTVLEACDEKTIGNSNRYVKMMDATEQELKWQLKRQDLFKGQGDVELFCVRMYGLPFKVTEYFVAQWLKEAESECIDVQIHLNHQGKKSGDATAFFNSQEEAKKSLSKDKQDMNGRYINLTLDTAPATFSSNNCKLDNELSLKMSGLPFKATEKEMKEFFLPEAKCLSVKVILNKDGRPSGDAIASFEDKETVEAALKKDREHLGSRFVVLSRLDEEHKSYSVKMSGLPFRTRVPEIIDWFAPVTDINRVRLLKNRENRPSGEAIADFATLEAAKEAMKKDKEYIGDRFVILTPINF
jgi:RNA recognition motif-containing protein